MACLNVSGIAFTINSRILNTVNRINTSPSIKTAAKALSQEYPMPCTNVKAKKAFNPIPGARAKGNFAKIAITSVAKDAAKAVAVNTAPRSIDAAERISGFTARIYDIVKKVVTPAMISVFTFITLGSNPKSFFNIIFIQDKTMPSLHVKTEVHHIPILHHVLFSFHRHLPGFLAFCLGSQGYKILVFNHFRTNKTFFEIRAVCGAFIPFLKVHALTSFGPAVK